MGKIGDFHIHITKKVDVSRKEKILNKVITILSAFLVCALICELFSSGSFFSFFGSLFMGSFSSAKQVIFMIEEFALLLGISMALLPAFKMRYWNLGAEGQIVLGGFGAAVVSKFIGPHVPSFVCVLLMIVFALLFASVWGLIPAFFKARFNTNETLFTLMLNYIAMGIVSFFIQVWDPAHGLMSGLTYGMFPLIFGQRYIISIIIVLVLFALMIVYIKKSKHGYELTVVGENKNTAKYVGINVPKVIIRTALISGAICGLMGLLIVGYANSCSANLAGGRGFTSVLIVWLGHFNPGEIALSSFLLSFLTKGASRAQTLLDLGSSFMNVCTGLFFLSILVGEFFLRYKIVITKKGEQK